MVSDQRSWLDKSSQSKVEKIIKDTVFVYKTEVVIFSIRAILKIYA